VGVEGTQIFTSARPPYTKVKIEVKADEDETAEYECRGSFVVK
jgi:hypothetical protein